MTGESMAEKRKNLSRSPTPSKSLQLQKCYNSGKFSVVRSGNAKQLLQLATYSSWDDDAVNIDFSYYCSLDNLVKFNLIPTKAYI